MKKDRDMNKFWNKSKRKGRKDSKKIKGTLTFGLSKANICYEILPLHHEYKANRKEVTIAAVYKFNSKHRKKCPNHGKKDKH